MAVTVLSFELPVALKRIFPVVFEESRQEILRLPAGDVMTPERARLIKKVAVSPTAVDEIIVVPSHNLQKIFAATVSCAVTVPDANHVPVVPCATLGPSK